ncbi:MFS polyamine transporter [Dentipellis sp. KUC8613]|nr:MFS polyamine transporter [Dentipellis sp. KUC8613]
MSSTNPSSETSTIVDPPQPPHAPHSPRDLLEEEIERDERLIEKYGADDPEDPPSKTEPTPVEEEKVDPNLVSWDGADDPTNPQNWSYAYKMFVTISCAFLTVNVTFASSMPSSATLKIQAHFHTQAEVSYLVTSLFLIGYIFGPIFWGPGSELLGRRPIFFCTLSTYTLFILGQALAHNIETLLVTRFLSGFFGCAPLILSGGVIADIWDAAGRGMASSLFGASVFLGPALGPVVGGFIVQSKASWRWVFWVMFIFAGVCSMLVVVLLPETYAPVILKKKAIARRKAENNPELYAEIERQGWSFHELLHRTVFRPFIMLLLEPILLFVTIYLSIVYGVIYALFEAFPVIFIGKHGLTENQCGMIFLGVGIGTTLGAIINNVMMKKYNRLIKTWHGFPPPETRLFGAMIGGFLLVVGIFWLGWSGEYSAVPWYVPAISTVAVGTAVSLIFISFLTYLVDVYLMYAASAFAANTFVRSMVGAAFPLFTVQMFENMGINWAATLIGLIGLVLAPLPFLFYRYGARIRMNSKFAPCIDLKIAKMLEAEKAKADGAEKV